uniref:Similarity. Hypothetical start n=1 Tax=Microcystis aeruginosa (strain PCC 7806) TaxID=267872 RepID=A8YGR8_MICA7|nr:unnamed protein product [Microcystis aeruginosa PCC 7806]
MNSNIWQFSIICVSITRPCTTRSAIKFRPQLQSMGMVRSPKSIAGAVGAILGNAPYKIGDLLCSAFGIALTIRLILAMILRSDRTP